jgi:hypothetical protein
LEEPEAEDDRPVLLEDVNEENPGERPDDSRG